MKSYGSRSLSVTSRHGGRSWKVFGVGLIIGFVGGFVAATAVQVKTPVELVIATPPALAPAIDAVSSNEIWSESKNISVNTPEPDALIKSPLIVEGMERTFEQNVVIRLRDGKGEELVKISTTGTAPDAGIHGPYLGELTFEKPATKTGTLEVFQGSPKDGSEIDKVTIPVLFE